MNILRDLPKMDKILEEPLLEGLRPAVRLRAAREVLDALRAGVLAGEIAALPCYKEILQSILEEGSRTVGLRKVINATGIVLHTNLGRAPLAPSVAQKVYEAALGYCDLEFDLDTGGRGSRMKHVEKLLVDITEAEAALVVNNNAAAVLLVLSALCEGKEVVASRGELVEIGGSFRVPQIVSQGGARLLEVGTTNATTVNDYKKAIDWPNTAALLKVHTSNYRIEGYTKEVSLAELSELARAEGIPLIYDLGGGALVGLSQHEPKVQDIIAEGVDVLCFSGDKLLGGPQAGIILGKADLIEKMRKHPLYRALRSDKLTLAALMAVLEIYRDSMQDSEQAKKDIPVLNMLTMPLDELKQKALKLLDMVKCDAEIVETNSQAGGGSLPGEDFPSYALAVAPSGVSVDDLQEKLRERKVPIIGRIYKDRLLLDVRTIDVCDFGEICEVLNE